MKIADLVDAMAAIAPLGAAAPWDNVGLLVGDTNASFSAALLTVDSTRQVLEEARAARCDAIVSYHPPIFDAQKRFVGPSVAFEAARAGIAIYSPHTALDAAEGGTNDALADALGLGDRAPLRAVASDDSELKLVTFVPVEHVETLSRALFAAGAGRIGKYSSCSFRAAGTGTFFGETGANPAVGQAGRLEEAAEIRVETVVPHAFVAPVVRALHAAHPYEEPAFDLVRLRAHPAPVGYGRVGTIGPATSAAVLAGKLKQALGASHVLVAGPLERDVSRAAVCAGSGGDLIDDAIDAGVELFVTGELRHHDVLRATAAGLTTVCVLHSTSERVALAALERSLSERLPGARISCSKADREPIRFA